MTESSMKSMFLSSPTRHAKSGMRTTTFSSMSINTSVLDTKKEVEMLAKETLADLSVIIDHLSHELIMNLSLQPN